jgi:TRAP-type mannitol/chloroaromatic compound transport system permease small subunit
MKVRALRRRTGPRFSRGWGLAAVHSRRLSVHLQEDEIRGKDIMQRLLRIADGLDTIIEWIGRIAAWSALGLVLLMAYNVLLRYFFRTGSVALQEMEWHIMAFLVLVCMCYTTLKDGHVQVDILYARFPDPAKRVITFISATLMVVIAAILLKLCIPYVMQAYNIGESSPDPGGLPHRWMLKALMPVGFTLLLLQSFSTWLRALAELFVGRTQPPAPNSGEEVIHAA